MFHMSFFFVLETCKLLRFNSLRQSPFRVCSAQAVPAGAAISQTAARLIHVDLLHLARSCTCSLQQEHLGTLVCLSLVHTESLLTAVSLTLA